jgi:ribosomal protein S15P/S13E
MARRVWIMKPIEKPWEQLKKASLGIEKMKTSKSLDEYEEHWKDYLHNLERAWNKLTSHLKKSPKFQGWNRRGQIEKLRKQDNLLSYLVNARGADEHSIEDITTKESGGIGINPVQGNSLTLNNLTINGGDISFESVQAVRVDFIPGKIRLLPITNRGRTYEVPSQHLGHTLKSADPVELSELAINLYTGYFKEAEEYFVK